MTVNPRDAALAAYAELVDAVNKLGEQTATDEVARMRAALRAAVTLHEPVSELSAQPPVCDRCKLPWPCLDVMSIGSALDVDVDLWAGMHGSSPQPPEGARVIGDDYTLAYSVPAEAHYARVLGDEDLQELTVFAVHNDGTSRWEFDLREQLLGYPVLLLHIYGTSFRAFADVPDLFEALRTDTPNTLAGLRVLLERHGAWDATPRQPPRGRSTS